MDIIKQLNWRYAVKSFDSSKKVSEEDFNKLLKVIQLSASSYGQQPYQIINVTNQSVRESLVEHSFRQDKVANASHLLVFAADTTIDDSTVDKYIEKAARVREVEKESIEGFGGMVKNVYSSMDRDQRTDWAARQAYLALGNLLTACAIMEIDACPMEGLNPAKYDEILGLTEKGLKTYVVVTLGYRTSDDPAQNFAKVRKDMDELVISI
ncbi:MAG: NAD(P)H-dependent oxidoreductase [Bacteroidota bacterium]